LKARYKQFDKPVLIGIKTQTMYFEHEGIEEVSMETFKILGKD